MLIGTVKHVRFTSGSPFGEQYWTIATDAGDRVFAMWMDLKSKLWARTGDKVKVKMLNDYTCDFGNCTTTLRNCAEIVEIIK